MSQGEHALGSHPPSCLEASTTQGTKRGGHWHDIPSGHLTAGLKGGAEGGQAQASEQQKEVDPTSPCQPRVLGSQTLTPILLSAGACALVSPHLQTALGTWAI